MDVERCGVTVAGRWWWCRYPWYTDVRKTLEDPAYAQWYFKFKPTGPWTSEKCDAAQPTLCSDFYHSQEQTPAFPHGDGDCLAPGCDCGKVPCGFYVWNHSSTAVVNGQTFQVHVAVSPTARFCAFPFPTTTLWDVTSTALVALKMGSA